MYCHRCKGEVPLSRDHWLRDILKDMLIILTVVPFVAILFLFLPPIIYFLIEIVWCIAFIFFVVAFIWHILSPPIYCAFCGAKTYLHGVL